MSPHPLINKKLTKRQAQRLLNVARALDESQHPERFTMERYIHDGTGSMASRKRWDPPIPIPNNWCGSPACALGHFAARTDLQRVFKIKLQFDILLDGVAPSSVNNHRTRSYFGISEDGFQILFSGNGCNGAKTTTEASNFIKQFVTQYS